MEEFWEKIESILPKVSRPGRYTGNEIHAFSKDWSQVEVSFALAFPDVYEIGMSNLGIEILYHVLNQRNWIVAERVYSPWIDMENLMREAGIPLLSLESKTPIRDFDILGITLQYELQYTNVLNILDLAEIPLRCEERTEKDPLVVAGGPCAYNPEPLADFLDAVALGDGEEMVVEIAEVVKKAKHEKWNRKKTLRTLSRLEGIYIPSFCSADYDSENRFKGTITIEDEGGSEVRARILYSLLHQNYPIRPLVPLIEVTHDRFSLEIMRGCTQGCRFCNAGMIYRPVRERSVEDLIKQTREVIAHTGYDEISLISLSTSDYRNLSELLSRLRNIFQGKGISISFPSLRPETFTPAIADFAQGLKRTGLTLAPEAGTQRLRDVINKNNREEDLLRAVEIAFEQGWLRLKLYFMVGLPTETREDLGGIVDMVGKVVQLGKKYGKKEIHVSISPFSPKPQTPFQWESQDSLEILEEKLRLLRQGMRWREVKLNWRDPKVSRLETILGRGDRKLGKVVYRAWDKGARFDAWTEHFDYDLWIRASEESHVPLDPYVKEINVNDPLPWDHLSKGISKSYLLQERKRAFSGEVVDDCRFGKCKGCGLMIHPVCRDVISARERIQKTSILEGENIVYGRRIRRVQLHPVLRKVRIGYSKGDEVRFTSHLDTVRIFTRTLRKANIPVAMSQGYHAHEKIATSPPLPLGYTSQAEYLDLGISDNLPSDFMEVLNSCLPAGFKVFGAKLIVGKVPSLTNSITLASYRIKWDEPSTPEIVVNDFLKKKSYTVIRRKKEVEREVDIRPYVVELSQKSGIIDLVLRLCPEGTARVDEVIRTIVPRCEDFKRSLKVERTGLYIEKNKLRLTPLEVE